MNAEVVEPVYVIAQFQSEPVQTLEVASVYEFRFEYFESGLRHSIVIRTALGLTERTIKYHIGKIIELLHLENRSQVIAYAVKLGIIQEPNS